MVSINIIKDDMFALEKMVERCDSTVVTQTLLIKNEADVSLLDKDIDNKEHSRFMDELTNHARYFQQYCSCKSLR